MADGFSTDNVAVSRVFTALRLTEVWAEKQSSGSQSPEAIAEAFKTLFNAVSEPLGGADGGMRMPSGRL